jgi:hypothetical protein
MSQVDPWEKAADCERAIKVARDPQAQAVLKSVQDCGSRSRTRNP